MIIPIHLYIPSHYIEKSLIAELKIPTFLDNGDVSTYCSVISHKIAEYAEKRRNLLIDHILKKTPKKYERRQIQSLQDFDLKTFYGSFGLYSKRVNDSITKKNVEVLREKSRSRNFRQVTQRLLITNKAFSALNLYLSLKRSQ